VRLERDMRRYTEPQDKMQWLMKNRQLWEGKKYYLDETLIRMIFRRMQDDDLYSPRSAYGEKLKTDISGYISKCNDFIKKNFNFPNVL
jgi:hypothetical protein